MRRGVQRGKCASGAHRIEGKPQFAGHNVRRAAGQNAEGYLAQRQAINNFVDGSIPAASQDHVSAVRDRGLRQLVRHGGPRGGRQLDFQPCLAQHLGGFADFALPPGRTPPRNRIINEDAFFQFWILDLRLWIGAKDLPAGAAGKCGLQSKVQNLKSGYCAVGIDGISTPLTTFLAIRSPVFLSVSTSM